MKRKFWNWVRNEGERTLFLNGEISDETGTGMRLPLSYLKTNCYPAKGTLPYG